jgi:hypothetical protein
MSRFAFIAALTLAAPAFAQAGYFAEIDDLPLPPGFAQLAPASIVEGPDGRLVVAYAEGRARGLAVREFYYEALPQLGWAVSPRDDGALSFVRGRERLSFTLVQNGERARLGVRLVTTPAR